MSRARINFRKEDTVFSNGVYFSDGRFAAHVSCCFASHPINAIQADLKEGIPLFRNYYGHISSDVPEMTEIINNRKGELRPAIITNRGSLWCEADPEQSGSRWKRIVGVEGSFPEEHEFQDRYTIMMERVLEKAKGSGLYLDEDGKAFILDRQTEEVIFTVMPIKQRKSS